MLTTTDPGGRTDEAVEPLMGRRFARRSLPETGLIAAGLLRSARPEQWCKNLLVVVLPIAAGAWTLPAVGRVALSFLTFTFAASGTYLLNDVVDRHADAAHPRKQHRPVASGQVPPAVAVGAGIGLIVTGLALPVVLGPGSPAVSDPLTVTVGGYLLLSSLYNIGGKHVPHLELAMVVAFFGLRTAGGAVAVGVALEPQLLGAVMATALALVAGKRLAERRDQGDDGGTRRVLRHYSPGYLDAVRTAAVAAAILAYGSWALAAAVRTGEVLLVGSILPVVVGFRRYSTLVAGGHGERPERIVWADRPLLATIVLAATSFGMGVPALG